MDVAIVLSRNGDLPLTMRLLIFEHLGLAVDHSLLVTASKASSRLLRNMNLSPDCPTTSTCIVARMQSDNEDDESESTEQNKETEGKGEQRTLKRARVVQHHLPCLKTPEVSLRPYNG